jgi:beta-glucosidase
VPSSATTPLAGLRARAGAIPVAYVSGPSLSGDDRKAISAATAAVVVVGLTADDEGERIVRTSGGDRTTLLLSAKHEGLVHEVAKLNPRTVVVMEGGSAIVVRNWVDEVSALVMAWYPGQEGGAALARVLFGDTSPSGKLPITFPRDEAQLPPFDSVSTRVDYGFFHGYRHVEKNGAVPEFSFGFGLSYTTFAYAGLRLSAGEIPEAGSVTATVDVTNTGKVAGDEVVQLFVSAQGSRVERAPRDLRAFARVNLEPGETKPVTLPLAARDLAFWDVAAGSAGAFVVEPIGYTLEVPAPAGKLTATLRVTR